jgi:polysaccharide export outer membrane protein
MMARVSRRAREFVVHLVLGASLVVAAGGCKARYPYKTCNQLPKTNVPVEAVPLRPGDQIVVQVPRMEELSGSDPFTVNADGTIVLPLVGVLQVEGLTAEAAARKLNGRLNGIIVNPAARISVVSPRMPVVAVVGEVRSPGRFDVAHDEGILRVLAQAGGLTEFADTKSIYVVRKYPTRERIRFDYDELVGGTTCSTDFVLQDGDVIVVE